MSISLLNQKQYLTDGGLETSLIYHHGIDLRHFSAFELLLNEKGRNTLRAYYEPYLRLAEQFQLGFILETPTWRANADWGFKLGYPHDELFALNRQSVKLMRELAAPFLSTLPHVLISGNIGPRGDGYRVEQVMTAEQAAVYHQDQVKAFATADADLVTGLTINYRAEAIGIIKAASLFNLPVVISFTVETDGSLPDGELLKDAIERSDQQTDRYASYYMINCAHPQHFINRIQPGEDWVTRIRGIRANASLKSHAELDESTTLDAGDKILLSEGYVQLSKLLPALSVIGGCCGTDHSHMEVLCQSLEKRTTLV